MTERQAWLKLAAMADKTADMGADDCAPMQFGLCSGVWDLRLGVVVTERMLDRIGRHLYRTRGIREGYCWPMHPGGYRARAAYCRRQVARIDRERKQRRAK